MKSHITLVFNEQETQLWEAKDPELSLHVADDARILFHRVMKALENPPGVCELEDDGTSALSISLAPNRVEGSDNT